MGVAYSEQMIRNQFEIEVTREQYTRLDQQINMIQQQENSVILSGIRDTRVEEINVNNNYAVTLKLDLAQEFAEENNLSQTLKAMLEATQQSVGLGAVAISSQRVINEARTTLTTKQIADIIKNTRIEAVQKNKLVMNDIEGSYYGKITIGNKGYNEDLVQNLMKAMGKTTTDQTGDSGGKNDQKVDSGLSLSALLGPLLLAAVIVLGDN